MYETIQIPLEGFKGLRHHRETFLVGIVRTRISRFVHGYNMGVRLESYAFRMWVKSRISFIPVIHAT